MIPYDVDPSLHTAKPEPQQLDDGFSPRHPQDPHEADAPPNSGTVGADALGDKSPF